MRKAASNLEYFNDEEKALLMYPKEKFIQVIQDVGFECDLCGKCCTRAFNDHVYLLKDDVNRLLEIKDGADALIPSPYFDFCDQHGRFYVSGYSLKTQNDDSGSCVFLQNGRCQIYEERPLICRVYPYMIHREADQKTYDWREISGLNEHGFYETEIKTKTAEDIFDETFAYEKGYIAQEKDFLKAVTAYFEKNKLKHIPKIHAERLRAYEKGGKVTVFVYHNGAFLEHRVQK